jgi:uncharacterized protein YndB with AHSA1/START domain
MKWLVFAGATVGLVLLVYVMGMLLPRTHKATRIAHFHQPPEVIWQTITDYEKFPQWRSNVSRVEPMLSTNGLPAHREWDNHGNALPMETVEFDRPHRLVGRIADPKLPFGGTWTMEISPEDGGSTLRITENGEIRNPIFRFVSRFFLGYTVTMETYLKDLGRKFGESVQPQP